MKKNSSALSDGMIELVARRFRLLGEPLRLRMLQMLESGEMTVNGLAEALNASQPNVSRHLTALFDGGLLERRREGNLIYYSIADPMVFKLCDLVCSSTRERIESQLQALAGGSPARGRNGRS